MSNPKWEFDPIMRGWRVVATKDGVRYQSASLFTHNDSLFASTWFAMQHARPQQWQESGINTFTLPAAL